MIFIYWVHQLIEKKLQDKEEKGFEIQFVKKKKKKKS